MIHKKIVSFLFLLLGISLLYLGFREVYLITTYFNSIFTISPATETKLLIILGAAAAVSGFVGMIRDRSIDI